MWNKDTDLVLRDLVLRQTEVDWGKIASTIEWDTGTVSAKECQARWEYVKETPVKGPWSSEEDEHLKRLVEIYGAKKWNLLARAFPGRSGKQCRERWHNHVDERVKKGEWTAEEDQILCEAQRQLGNKWSEMSRILHGRSENAIKNRFNSLNAKGLTETRANELLSKVGPAALAAAGHHPPNAFSCREFECSHHERAPPVASPQNIPHRLECSAYMDTGSARVPRGAGYDLQRAVWGAGGGFDGVGGSGGGTGAGSSAGSGLTAMHALMAAVTEEREANEVVTGGARVVGTGARTGRYSRNDDTVPRDTEGSDAGSRDWGEDGVDGDTESLCGGGGFDGGRGEKVGAPTRRRGTKREREEEGQYRMGDPWEISCNRGDVAREPIEPVRVLMEASRRIKGSPRGMSILARAAGLVEVEDEEESFTASASGSKDEASDTSSVGLRTPNNTTDSVYHSMNDRRVLKRTSFFRHSGGTQSSSRIGSCSRISVQDPSKLNALDSRMGAASILRSMIDHGSTPPGSVSPPPSVSASGGTDVAAGGGGGGGSGNGGAGGVGASGSSRCIAGIAGIDGNASLRTDDGGGDGGRDEVGKRWCGKTELPPSCFSTDVGETVDLFEGACDGIDWRKGFQSPLAGPASVSPRSGWYVGPEGTYRRGLGSVPGPWRPYWRGENEVNGDLERAKEGAGANPQPAETRVLREAA